MFDTVTSALRPLDLDFNLAHGQCHTLHCLPGTALHLPEDTRDFLCRLRGTFSELAHLVGHHREPAPLLPGTRRLNRCIECQQVRLFGNLTDHPSHRQNVLAIGINRFDTLCGMAHRASDRLDTGHSGEDDLCPLLGLALCLLGGQAGFMRLARHQ